MEDSNFSIFEEAVQKTGLSENVKKDKSTLFVPTNEAFENLKISLGLSSIEELLAQENLSEVILNHIVYEKLLLEDIDKNIEFETVAGDNIVLISC